jgi:hypothetical protein
MEESAGGRYDPNICLRAKSTKAMKTGLQTDVRKQP